MIMSELTLLIRHMVGNDILTYDELEENIRLSKMSMEELVKEVMTYLDDEKKESAVC